MANKNEYKVHLHNSKRGNDHPAWPFEEIMALAIARAAGDPDAKVVGSDVIVHTREAERALLAAVGKDRASYETSVVGSVWEKQPKDKRKSSDLTAVARDFDPKKFLAKLKRASRPKSEPVTHALQNAVAEEVTA